MHVNLRRTGRLRRIDNHQRTSSMSHSRHARNINGVSQHIIDRHIAHCTQADPAYGAGVKAALEAVRAGTLS